MAEEKQVTVHLIEENPDGTKRVGNSHECSVAEAISLIEADAAKAEGFSRGQVPPEWTQQPDEQLPEPEKPDPAAEHDEDE